MRGKVKYVKRKEWFSEVEDSIHNHDTHAIRHTCTYAVLYSDDRVYLSEDDIRDFYGWKNLTANRISELSSDLHNVWIEYSEDWDGDYCLDGELRDYI